MANSLDSLSRDLVGMNGMICEECGSEMELTHMDENYAIHGTWGKCWGASHWKLEIDQIFDNLRVSDMDEQFWLLPRKGVYPYEFIYDREKFKENCFPWFKHSTEDSVCWALVSVIMSMPRGFGESLGWRIWEIITISISKPICCCWVTSLKPSGQPV